MSKRRSLRTRIILSFLILGTLLSVLFAGAALVLQQYLEDELIGDTLKQELDAYVDQLHADPTVVEPFYSRIQGYVTRPGDPNASAPAQVRALPSGVHEVERADRTFRAAISKDDEYWVFLMYDVTENQQLARQLVWSLLGVVILFSLLSLAIGLWAARRVMRPVSDLAARLQTLGDQSPPPSLAAEFPDDEVGQLAAALDDYAERLHELVERDLEFNADVSHELRTPLSVISGATELLLAQSDLPEKIRTRLLRIARAARQSSDITTALLHLVRAERGSGQRSEAQNVYTVVEQVVHLYQPLVGNKELAIEVVEEDRVSVIAPESVVSVTIGNLLGNAIRYTAEGAVRITVGNGRCMVEDSGPGIDDAEIARVMERHYRGSSAGASKGSGLGLAIVRRLCELYGWTIHFENRDEGGLRAEVRFF